MNESGIIRIAIVNRGEAAVRLLRAVRELNGEQSDIRFEVVALHTSEEAQAGFVRDSDMGYDLGPASSRPYLDYAVLERALVETQATAAWVGWGFVAEDAAFAELCQRLGVVFIGPSADSMRLLGDKIASKKMAQEVGVPVAPWSQGPVDTLDEALAWASDLGYPVVLKATAGGGGRGIHIVAGPDELADVYGRTRGEAERAFGSGVVFLESMVSNARHIEVQVVADQAATAWAIGVRDCSIQRRNQKVIEESASPLLDTDKLHDLRASAERLAIRAGYVGVCTVEFLYEPHRQAFAFLEVNTRLQVEHPVTEVTTGCDLVKLQLHVAFGGSLGDERPVERGHAIEARLNAEDPDRDFTPAPGRIQHLVIPQGPGIRVDSGYQQGDTVPSFFDSMIAKVIAHGATREEALARLRAALLRTEVVIEGGSTNKTFLLTLLDRRELTHGEPDWADTRWIERALAHGELATGEHAEAALLVAAVEQVLSAEHSERALFLDGARRGRPRIKEESHGPLGLMLRGQSVGVDLRRVGARSFSASVIAGDERRTLAFDFTRTDAHRAILWLGHKQLRVVLGPPGPIQFVEVEGSGHRITLQEGGAVRAPAPALVVAVSVNPGDEVSVGQRLVVLEAMKMETVIAATAAGRVKEVLTTPGSQVEAGTTLVRLEAEEDEGTAAGTGASATTLWEDLGTEEEVADPHRLRGVLRNVLLGYDIPHGGLDALLERYLACRVPEASSCLTAEADLLDMVVDVVELHRNCHPAGACDGELAASTTREYYHTYLRSLDVEREKLPATFVSRLQRAVSHYGLTSLDVTEDLEEAVFLLFRMETRWQTIVEIANAILTAWNQGPRPSVAGERIREVLSRFVGATQRRFRVLADAARAVRIAWFDVPDMDAQQAMAGVHVPELLSHVVSLPKGTTRREVEKELVNSAGELAPFMAIATDAATRTALLRLLVERHYRGPYEAEFVEIVGSRQAVVARIVLDGCPTTVVAMACDAAEVGTCDDIASLLRQASEHTPEQRTFAELYLVDGQEDDVVSRLSEDLTAANLPANFAQVCLAFVPRHRGAVRYVTLQREGDGFVEDAMQRGLHPMVGRDLDMWREHFSLSLVDTQGDAHMFHAIGRENTHDQRLVALCHVRRLAITRNAKGDVLAMPGLERALIACVDGLRAARANLPDPMDRNHVGIHLRGEARLDTAALRYIRDHLAPLTADAGVERVVVHALLVRQGEEYARSMDVRFSHQPGLGVRFEVVEPSAMSVRESTPLDELFLKAKRRGLVHPFELFPLVAGAHGTCRELDLDDTGRLVLVERAPGQNTAGVIVAEASTPTPVHPEGIRRVLVFGDPLKALGAIGRREADRIIAALALAEERQLPVEWYALSSGARISRDSGTENMDAVAAVLRQIVEFSQRGGEINVVVTGINVGAQPYWNAEATMLMHTRGVLVMTPESAMVLTGKQSLDFSGGVSAEDNFGIGGFARIMGPNGQAQYWAPDLTSAHGVLMRHYEHSYVAPGERWPRSLATSDSDERDPGLSPHDMAGSEFETIAQIFSPERNPDRKKPFDIRSVMRAVADADHPPLERWATMANADMAVVFDTAMGGMPVSLLGIESRAVPRGGAVAADGPDTFTAGTLFPQSSKKLARAINAASGNRPVVVLANLSGFDGSPESMRQLQLEYGAEIGRAVVNFAGPIVFIVISRYHGGAFVVFSKALNPGMTVLALEGSFASVIGGAPAAAVVFARQVTQRVESREEVRVLKDALSSAPATGRAELVKQLDDVRAQARAEETSRLAAEFDAIHTVQRAVEVGSIDEIVSLRDLRKRVIEVLRGSRQ